MLTQPAEGRTNVCTEIVAHDLCIGCGMCEAVCPRDNLRMGWNEQGGYSPRSESNQGSDFCHMCIRACPFSDQEENEDTIAARLYGNVPGINFNPQVGYYLRNYVGYSKIGEHRENGSSGGIITWMLETLLKRDLVDAVICVSPSSEPGTLFKYVVCDNVEKIRSCSKSAYYPVEMSKVIRHILRNKGRYAITVLPCFAKAIRLAAREWSQLSERVPYLIGLGCSFAQSRYLTEYVCAVGGGDPFHLDEFEFRIKDATREPHDFGLRFVSNKNASNEKTGLLHLHSLDRPFALNACYYCDDLYAEVADVMVKDAWMDPYQNDYRGHSVVVTRHPRIQSMLQEGIDHSEIVCKAVDVSEVINSQRGGDLALCKRDVSAAICRIGSRQGFKVPHKREPFRKVSFLRRKLIQRRWEIAKQSRIEWPKCNKNIEAYRMAMFSLVKRYRRAGYLYYVSRHPIGALSKVMNKLCRLGPLTKEGAHGQP